MTETQTPDPRFDVAEAALAALYDAWETNGGPSPSTYDEAHVVAEALGVDPVTDDAAIEVIWDIAQDGAELRMIGIAHVAAIDAADGR